MIDVRKASKEKPFVIPSLDGIRALAVSVVFLGHAGISNAPSTLGVTIFFFLSGFLITTLLRMEFEKARTISFRAFYLRRALRLFPPLYLVLGVACVLTLIGVFGVLHLRLSAVLAQFFYLSNYQILQSGWQGPGTGRPPGTGDLWSLAVEEHFYLLFPLAYLLLRRHIVSARRQALVLGGVCFAVLAWRFVLILGMHASFDRTYAATDTRIDSILFGCILAILANPVLDHRNARVEATSFWRKHWAELAAPFCLIVIDISTAIQNVNIAGTLQYTVQGLALMPLFVVVVRHHRWGVIRLLNLRVVRYVGALSYSIYIVEQILIFGIGEHLRAPHIVKGLVYLAATLLVAMAIHHFVERPCARLRRRLARVGRPAPANAAEITPMPQRQARPAPSVAGA